MEQLLMELQGPDGILTIDVVDLVRHLVADDQVQDALRRLGAITDENARLRKRLREAQDLCAAQKLELAGLREKSIQTDINMRKLMRDHGESIDVTERNGRAMVKMMRTPPRT